MKKHSTVLFGFIFWLTFAGVLKAERPVVLVTVFPVQSLIMQITGSDIRVDGLIPPNVSPHTYKPDDNDFAKIRRADLLVCVGLGLDDWALIHAQEVKTPVVALGEILNEPPDADPHLWMEPILMANALTSLQNILAKNFPTHSPAISAGIRRTVDSLFTLDRWTSTQLSPYLGAGFVSFHGAFKRFTQRYGLATIAVLIEKPEAEPPPSDFTQVVEKLKRFSRRVIFYEPQFDSEPAQTVATQADAQLIEIDPLGSPRVPGRENYFNLMRYNVRQMVAAFKGKE